MKGIPTMRDVERYGYAVFPDEAVDALLGPMPPGVRREDTRPYHPETWPPDKPGLEYLHRALARRLIGELRARLIIGIDPGADGAIALLDPQKGTLRYVGKEHRTGRRTRRPAAKSDG